MPAADIALANGASSPCLSHRACLCRDGLLVRLEDSDELAVTRGNLIYCLIARNLLRQPVHQRIPGTGPEHDKADEPGHGRRDAEPFAPLGVALAAPG